MTFAHPHGRREVAFYVGQACVCSQVRLTDILLYAITSFVKQLAFSKDAARTLTRMPSNTAKLIRSKLEQYASNPESLANNIKTLKGEPGVYRLRVADWRVLFSESGQVIAIIKVAPRGGAYD
jgi:mRNA interferase RelE/StbE